MRTLTQLGLFIAAALLAATPAAAQSTSKKVQAAAYSAAKSCAGLQSFLKSYPEGGYVPEATARLARQCPAECLETDAAWNLLRDSDDAPAIRAYLAAAPAACAVQREQAQTRLKQIAGE